jgi:hypothetical protein
MDARAGAIKETKMSATRLQSKESGKRNVFMCTSCSVYSPLI